MASILWQPSADRVGDAVLTRYVEWLGASRGLDVAGYEQLHRWSVTDLAGFWNSIWEYAAVEAAEQPRSIVDREQQLPGARWFDGARLNYASRALSGEPQTVAVLAYDESGGERSLTLHALQEAVAKVAHALRAYGVGVGDRVVGYLPNVPEALVAFLATASIGAIWSCCPPDFGPPSVIDRFAQIRPKALIGAASYRYGGQWFDRRTELQRIRAGLPDLTITILVGDADVSPHGCVGWDDLPAAGSVEPLPVPAEHPLWIVYSSGTTGLPKAIVHSHGGILLEHLKSHALHLDLRPGDRLLWHSSTGWVMWNLLVGGLLVDATVVLYDGSPAHPGAAALWSIAERSRATLLGAGAPLLEAALSAGLRPGADHDLSCLRTVGSTGAPLVPAAYRWVYEHVAEDVLLASISGGTDVCTAFVGSVPTLPVREGEMQGPWLGVAVAAYDEHGQPVVGRTGELVVTRPMPSMPTRFWGDVDGRRYRAAYFERFPGVWHHGDWLTITADGGAVISGRSDGTLKRGGVRMGTADFYRVVEALPEVVDALVVDTAGEGGNGALVLFVVLADGERLDDALAQRIRGRVRADLSPRHVPDHLVAVPAVPRTLSGKKVEVPVKRLLLGLPREEVISPAALADADALTTLLAAARAAGITP